MEIIPVRVEYFLEVMNHTMKASAEHFKDKRIISFLFDDKVVSQKEVEPGDFLTDDDWICELVEKYCKNTAGVYADIFRRHSDKVSLIAKSIEITIDNYGIEIYAHVTVEKDRYIIELSANDGEDKFLGTFRAMNFSEVLEKLRLFSSTLGGISVDLTQHINELSNDKVEEWIKWQ